jgi:hypothetical protein
MAEVSCSSRNNNILAGGREWASPKEGDTSYHQVLQHDGKSRKKIITQITEKFGKMYLRALV